MVDRDLARRKLAALDDYLCQLEEFAGTSAEAYGADWRIQRVIERTLHLAIETCMDIADHVVADEKWRVPETGAETFEILGEHGTLPPDLARSLARMVGFRNILVHDYTRLDPAVVLRVLHHDLADVRRFRDAIAALIGA